MSSRIDRVSSSDQSFDVGEPGDDLVKLLVPVQRALRRVPRRVEFVEVPAQTVDLPGPFADQVLTVIDQQPHLATVIVEAGRRQVRFAQRRPRHRQRVDRVGLAVSPGGVASLGHHLRRHAHDRFAGRQEVTLQPARQVSAVLHRPASISSKPVRPADKLEVIRRRRRCRGVLAELAARLVDSHHGVRSLVRVDSQYQHVCVALHSVTRTGRQAQLSWGRRHAPIKPCRPVHYVPGAATGILATKATVIRSQPPGTTSV